MGSQGSVRAHLPVHPRNSGLSHGQPLRPNIPEENSTYGHQQVRDRLYLALLIRPGRAKFLVQHPFSTSQSLRFRCINMRGDVGRVQVVIMQSYDLQVIAAGSHTSIRVLLPYQAP